MTSKSHARLSASGAYIWLNCTAAPSLSVGLERRPSKWADEGTRAHSVAETMQRNNGVAPGDEGEAEAMAKWVQPYVDYTTDLARRTPLHAIEKKVSLAGLWEREGETPPEDMFGTADFIALTPDRVLHVVDLKYGAGVAVDVKDNPQLLYYALGTVLSLPPSVKAPETVRMTIAQPRAAHPDGPIRHYDTPTVDLLDWGYSVVKPTVEKIVRNNPDELVIVEGKQCRWCAANSADACPLKRKTKTESAKHDFANITD